LTYTGGVKSKPLSSSRKIRGSTTYERCGQALLPDDALIEDSPEIFTVDLSNPVGATLQGEESVNVLIIDDDIPH
jgi:hypothetical protein